MGGPKSNNGTRIQIGAAFRSRLDATSDYLTYILPLEKSHLIAVRL